MALQDRPCRLDEQRRRLIACILRQVLAWRGELGRAELAPRVLAAIARANERLGTTTIIITHNAAIAGMADRVLRLGGGRIVSEECNSHRLSANEVHW